MRSWLGVRDSPRFNPQWRPAIVISTAARTPHCQQTRHGSFTSLHVPLSRRHSVIVAGDDSTLIIQCIGTIDETPNYLKPWNVWVNWRIQADYPRSIINHLGDASMSGKIFGPRTRGGRCNRKRVQLRFEAMESRVLLATTFLVTNTNDDGAWVVAASYPRCQSRRAAPPRSIFRSEREALRQSFRCQPCRGSPTP